MSVRAIIASAQLLTKWCVLLCGNKPVLWSMCCRFIVECKKNSIITIILFEISRLDFNDYEVYGWAPPVLNIAYWGSDSKKNLQSYIYLHLIIFVGYPYPKWFLSISQIAMFSLLCQLGVLITDCQWYDDRQVLIDISQNTTLCCESCHFHNNFYSLFN